MSRESRRSAERVSLEGSVHIDGTNGIVEADMRDLSRTGVRIRLRASRNARSAGDLLLATQDLYARIGKEPTVKLFPERLGALVSRTAFVTRVILPPDDPAAVEVGCRFDRPLTDKDTLRLGVELDVAKLRKEAPTPRADTGRREVRVHVPVPADVQRDDDGSRVRTVRYEAHIAGRGIEADYGVEGISTERVIVRMKRIAVPVTRSGREMIRIVMQLSSRFGGQVRMRVVSGVAELWKGTVRVSGVDLPDNDPESMLVSFSFPAPLNKSERARLRF